MCSCQVFETVTMLVELIASLALATNVFGQNDNDRLINYIESSRLVYTDIYQATKPFYKKCFKLPRVSITISEINPIADVLFQQNFWDLGFTAALSANILALNLLDRIDKRGVLSLLYTAAICSIEFYSIYKNIKMIEGIDRRQVQEFYVESKLITITF
jgi:hypothetical protein